MNGRVLFPEPLDTVRTTDHELAVAEHLLRIVMASPQGAVLSTTHAVDSALILDERLSGNPAFLLLVQSGRVRFAYWPNGQGPREVLEAALGASEEEYRFSGWPELRNNPELRRLALKVWKQEQSATGVDSLDARIERARRLYASIEVANEQRGIQSEAPRAKLFADKLADSPKWLPRDETSREVAEQVSHLSEYEDRNSRSKVYHWIDSRDMSQDANARLKDLVDARYNKTVADSLGIPFMSARRVWHSLPNDYHETEAESASIELLKPMSETPYLAPVEWGTIRRALDIYVKGPASREGASEAFREILASVAPLQNKVALGGATFGLTVAIGIAFALEGAARSWASGILLALGEAISLESGRLVGEVLGKKFDKDWRVKRLEEYSGWIDSL
jgi:hypothetical protein